MPISVKQLLDSTNPSEPHPADEDYVPPVASVALPSKGHIYPPESPLYLCETVDIKPITASEENILSSTTLIKKGLVLSALMRACITNRAIDPDMMLAGDRNAILTSIRVSAYGPAYNCTVICSDCAETFEHSFDLSRLKLDTLKVESSKGPGTNDFVFTLPTSGHKVHFKLLNAHEIQQLEADIDALRKKGQERSVTLRLQSQIISVDGIEQKNLARFISAMPALDSRRLRAYMDEISPGVDMRQEFECPACAHKEEVDIPIGTEFFWPSEV